jgi:hypothetical protein
MTHSAWFTRLAHLGRNAALSVGVLVGLSANVPAQAQPEENIGHTRHLHHNNEPHGKAPNSPDRFITTRSSDIVLPLPEEKDAFTFVVYGDRTGGPVKGVSVLADAVRDTNLLEPDFVITVGDLIEGYNAQAQWRTQMTEFKGIMDELLCPWFPVAGNHDIYWRGPDRPARQHEGDYETHFGPLWYAFEHKNCWFIALHSDEGNPETGEFTFEKPEAQRMSPEQFEFLKMALERAKDADHVFLFLHHPRWLRGGYGDDWDRVHDVLVQAGNVTAVFAGHIHNMRYDPKDGIDYVALATVGGAQEGTVPEAGWLHQFHVVTVRKQQVAMAALPVGEVMDVREITGELAEACAAQAAVVPVVAEPVRLSERGGVEQIVSVTYQNVSGRDLEVTLMPDSGDSRWVISPDHHHASLAPGETVTRRFAFARGRDSADQFFRDIEIVTDVDVLMPGHRYSLKTRRDVVPVDAALVPLPAPPASDLAISLGGDDALLVPGFTLPDGPLTVECWLRADEFGPRTGLLCKTESAEFGIFVNLGKVEWNVHLAGEYVTVGTEAPVLQPGRWHHVAGVFDGAEVRVYVDGELKAKAPGAGRRRTNRLPFIIGADVSGDGTPSSFFKGQIDEVRVASRALYEGERFVPQRRLDLVEGVELLTHFDGRFGLGVWGEGPRRIFGRVVGDAPLEPCR